MIINCIVYVLEIMKYYLVMYNFLGFRERKNKWLGLLGLGFIILFSYYITYTTDNPLGIFVCFILAEMVMLFKEKFFKIIISSVWLMFVIGMLDDMFEMLIRLLDYKTGILGSVTEEMLSFLTGLMTVVFLGIIVIIVRFKTGGYTIKFTRMYYMYFTVLAIVEGIMVGLLERAMKEEGTSFIVYVVTVASVFVLLINIGVVVFLAVSKDGYKQRDELNQEYMKIQEKNYLYIREVNQDVRSFKHDVKSHMLMIKRYSKNKEYDKLEQYVNRITEDLHMTEERITVSNGIVDAILNQFAYEAEQEGVKFSVSGQLFENTNIAPYDLCVIFSNTLKNALEAAKESEEKIIEVEIKRETDQIEVEITNSFLGERNKKDGKYYTTKGDELNHGLGMENIKRSMKKYNGCFRVFEQDNMFVSYIQFRQ